MKTNADILLNKAVSTDNFIHAMLSDIPIRDYTKNDANIVYLLRDWLDDKYKPYMTEAEKTILENIGDNFDTILRTETGYLKLKSSKDNTDIMLNQFKDHLFQFIENGDKYKIEELLEDD